jgi:hypothetical protein
LSELVKAVPLLYPDLLNLNVGSSYNQVASSVTWMY